MSGAQLVKTQGSGDYTGKVQRYHVDSGHASLLAIGDFVTLSGQSDSTGLQEVDAAAAGNQILGFIVGFEPNLSSLETKGLAASTAGYVLVQTDPYAQFEIEISGTALTAAMVGLNCDILATAATSSGNLVRSNMTINGSATPSTATQQLRIVGLVDEAGQTLGAVGQKALCRINESTEKGTVGI